MITLGGSDVPAVLGLDPFTSPYALGCRKLGLTSEPPESEAMRHGLRLQAAHAEMIEDAGYDVMPAPAAGFVHPELPWLHVHPDFLIGLDGERAPLEVKLRGNAPSEAIWQRDYLQTFVYVHTLGATRGMLSELHGGYGGFGRDECTVLADQELFDMSVDTCERFLALLAKGKLPAPSGSDSDREAIRARFAQAETGKTIRLSQAEWGHVRKIRELDEVIARAKAQRERHAEAVQEAMGDATEAISPYDTVAARWRQVTSTRTDTKALKAAHPAIAAEFAKTTTYRKFEANP